MKGRGKQLPPFDQVTAIHRLNNNREKSVITPIAIFDVSPVIV
jgi:hypothetical protein